MLNEFFIQQPSLILATMLKPSEPLQVGPCQRSSAWITCDMPQARFEPMHILGSPFIE